MGEKSTFPFEVAVRVKTNLETLTLILKPQSTFFLSQFRTLFMVGVRVRVISGCDVTFNKSTAVPIKLQTEKCFFYPAV